MNFGLLAIATKGPIPAPVSILHSLPATSDIRVFEWKKALSVSKPQPGIMYKYFEPSGKINLSSVSNNPLAAAGTTATFFLS